MPRIALFVAAACALPSAAMADVIVSGGTFAGTGTIMAGESLTNVTISSTQSSILVAPGGTATGFVIGDQTQSQPLMSWADNNKKAMVTGSVFSINSGAVVKDAQVYWNGYLTTSATNMSGNAPGYVALDGTVIHEGGLVVVSRNALAANTTINRGGIMFLSVVRATATNTLINDGGLLQLGAGNVNANSPMGYAQNTTISGSDALLSAMSSGTSSTANRGSVDGVTIINGGNLWLGSANPSATTSAAVFARNITITNGNLVMWDDSTVATLGNDNYGTKNVTVHADGIIRITGTAEKFPWTSHLAPDVHGATIIDLTMDDGKVIMAGIAGQPAYVMPSANALLAYNTPASVSQLPLSYSAAKTLTIKNSYSGTGNFYMGANLAAGTGDRIDLVGVTSNGAILVTATSSTAPTAGTRYEFVHMDKSTTDASPKIKLSGTVWYYDNGGPVSSPLEIGANSDNGLSLGIGLPEPTAWHESAASSAYIAAIADWYANIQPLTNRMGELRMGTASGVWFNGTWRKQQVRPDSDIKSDVWSYNVQLGADRRFKRASSTTHIGVMGDYGTGTQDFHAHGDGTTQSWAGGVYATNFWNNGWYADLVGRYQTQSQKITLITPLNANGEHSEYTMPGGTLSIEAGKGFHGRRVYLEPQIQIAMLYTKAVDYQTPQAAYHMDSSTPIVSRLGLLIARPVNLREMRAENSKIARPYARISIINTSNAKNTLAVTPINDPEATFPKEPHTWSADTNGTSVEGTVGINARFNNTVQLYGELTTRWGGKVDTPLSATAGLRFNF